MATFFQSAQSTRRALLIIWVISFAAAMGAVIYLNATEEIETEDLALAMKKISALYAPYVGAIIAFYFSKGKTAQDAPAAGGSRAGNILAIVCSLLWNGLILFFLLRLVLLMGFFEDAMETIATAGELFTWLIALPLGYYFGKSGAEEKS